MKSLKIIIALLSFGLLLFIGTIVTYNTMLSKNSFYAVTGTKENYTWSAANLSIQLYDFYMAVSRNDSFYVVNKKFDLLFSRVNVLKVRSESTEALYREDEYKETIEKIYQKMNEIENILNSKGLARDVIIAKIDSIRPLSTILMNKADHAESNQRTLALAEFNKRRSQLIILLFVTGGCAVFLCIVIYIYLQKINKMLLIERAALINKNAFLGIIGHELRTSLQVIVSAIDVIASVTEKNHLDERIKKPLQRLLPAAEKMERQMSDLAEFARIDNGNVTIRNINFRLKELIENTVQECISIYSKKHSDVSVTIHITHDEVVYADPTRLMQLVENLTSNALKYTEKGAVNVSCHIEHSRFLILTVKDTGLGMPNDKINLIFTPFFRFTEGKTSSLPGFGMGMAIVFGILKAMKGTINISSEVGIGTTATVKVPVRIGNAEMLATENVSRDIDADEIRHIHILLVDDNTMACSSLANLLDGVGYVVESTTQPERALQKLQRKPYDIILSDLQMPLLTGQELYQKLRSQPGPNQETPVIFISAFADCSPVDGVPLLTKPVRIKDINETIHIVRHNA